MESRRKKNKLIRRLLSLPFCFIPSPPFFIHLSFVLLFLCRFSISESMSLRSLTPGRGRDRHRTYWRLVSFIISFLLSRLCVLSVYFLFSNVFPSFLTFLSYSQSIVCATLWASVSSCNRTFFFIRLICRAAIERVIATGTRTLCLAYRFRYSVYQWVE